MHMFIHAQIFGNFSPHSSTHKWMDSTFMFPVEVILDGQNSATWPGILDLTKAPGTSVLPLPVKAIPQASWQPPPATCIIPILFPSIAGNFFHKFIWQRFNESS